jgi:Ser/Thr protein kinase RdoA (MazF antagonist)
MRRYPGAVGTARGDWRDHLAFIRAHIPPDKPPVRRECDQIEAALGALPVDRDRYGLIHFDFELDNLYWQDQTIAMLDFDDCTHYWYAADVAFALRDLFADGVDLSHRSFRAFMGGYRAWRPLDDDMLSLIPLFLRLANLLGYARLVRALDLPRQPDHPAWL